MKNDINLNICCFFLIHYALKPLKKKSEIRLKPVFSIESGFRTGIKIVYQKIIGRKRE